MMAYHGQFLQRFMYWKISSNQYCVQQLNENWACCPSNTTTLASIAFNQIASLSHQNPKIKRTSQPSWRKFLECSTGYAVSWLARHAI